MSGVSQLQYESEIPSRSKVVYEEKNYKLRSKSGRKNHKESANSSVSQEFCFNDVNFKKKQWLIERTSL